MKPVQNEACILPCHDGDGVIYAASYDGIWLTLEVTADGASLCVDMHAPFAIADSDACSLREFIAKGEPAHDCKLHSPPCWTVMHRWYSASAELLPESGVPGEDLFDAVVLYNLSQLARDAPEDAEALRVGWRVRFARRVAQWAVPS